MAETPDSDPAEATSDLPEKIGLENLGALNEALAVLLQDLRNARRLPAGETHGRLGAVTALCATWRFLMRFEPVLAETLHVPLLNLHGALQALNDGTVEQVLKPAISAAGGRTPDGFNQEKVVGFAVGAVGRLRWTGMSPRQAHKAVAEILKPLGVRSSRGTGTVTPRTVRGWCERVAADVALRSIAAQNVQLMLTEKWRRQLSPKDPQAARRFILDALIQAVTKTA
jgi:hypothetical protein